MDGARDEFFARAALAGDEHRQRGRLQPFDLVHHTRHGRAGAEEAGNEGLERPLERDGILVRRSRELLEMEIERFLVLESDGVIAGCAALYPFPEEQAAEQRGKKAGFRQLFVLTTRTEHWFEERGFVDSSPDHLPRSKQALYNYKRKSKVLQKSL